MESGVVFEDNVVEFVTVSAEYCVYVERIAGKDRQEACDVLLKLLPLLYLKASMLPETEESDDAVLSECVTESDYGYVRSSVNSVFAAEDGYLEVFTEDMQYSDMPVCKSVSESLADIYQPLRNFVELFRTGENEIMSEALAHCREQFVSYWGQELLNCLRAIHNCRYSQIDTYTD